jgi:hypothetical protein
LRRKPCHALRVSKGVELAAGEGNEGGHVDGDVLFGKPLLILVEISFEFAPVDLGGKGRVLFSGIVDQGCARYVARARIAGRCSLRVRVRLADRLLDGREKKKRSSGTLARTGRA